ncbi:MAG TPA: Hpt domain-containing protein [Burkholderiales bacterium]|nr:Hpt domain-containing protein [Burkholderiales bacterium]
MKTRKDFEQQLKVLKVEFRRALPERIGRIEELWSGMQAAVPTSQHLRELKRAFHMLAGSASTFGFADVGDAARIAERALNTYGSADIKALLTTVQQSIAVMRERATEEEHRELA